MDVADSVPGPTADITVLEKSQLLSRLPSGVGGIGDLAYVGIDKLHPKGLGASPRRKPRGKDRPPDAPLWVSLATNGTRSKRLSTRAIEQICQERLGTGKAHVLWHSFARALEDAGAKVSEIQARLGHESLAMTGRYLAALRADENPHADALAALFGLDAE